MSSSTPSQTRSPESSGRVRVSGYDGPAYSRVRPRTFALDQLIQFTRATWTVWNGHEAVGRAFVSGHDCDPYCAVGHPWHGWASVTLTAPFSSCGRSYFAVADIRYDHRQPYGGRGEHMDLKLIFNPLCGG